MKKFNDYQRKLAEGYMKRYKVAYFLYKINLEDSDKIVQLNHFYYKLFEKILANKDEEFIVPQHYFNDYISIQSFNANIIKKYYSLMGMKNFKIYSEMLELFLTERFEHSNPNVKAKFMDLLFTLNIMENGLIVGELLHFFQTEESLGAFVKNLMKFYSSVEFITDHANTGVNKFRYRFFISKFLLVAL